MKAKPKKNTAPGKPKPETNRYTGLPRASVPFTFYMTHEQNKRLKILAPKAGQTKGEFLRRCIDQAWEEPGHETA